MAYSRANVWAAKKIQWGVEQSALRLLDALAPSVLQRILDGAWQSPELSKMAKSFLACP